MSRQMRQSLSRVGLARRDVVLDERAPVLGQAEAEKDTGVPPVVRIGIRHTTGDANDRAVFPDVGADDRTATMRLESRSGFIPVGSEHIAGDLPAFVPPEH